VSQTPRKTVLAPAREYFDRGQAANPAMNVARQQERIAELVAQRSKWSFIPNIMGVATHTERNGEARSYFGASLAFPVGAQNFTQLTSATAQAERAKESTRQATLQLQVDVERLRALADSGQQELAIRRDAIAAAELAVQANLKSQLGGIRAQVDVLNAIQALADTRIEYANTAASLAENYVTLLLQSGSDPAESLARVQQLVF
jgi:outer membrane protein TolC